MSQYRVVIVGCGGRSRPHIHAYDEIGEAEVVALYASTLTREPIDLESFIPEQNSFQELVAILKAHASTT